MQDDVMPPKGVLSGYDPGDPFLDWIQRESAGLPDDISAGLCGG